MTEKEDSIKIALDFVYKKIYNNIYIRVLFLNIKNYILERRTK